MTELAMVEGTHFPTSLLQEILSEVPANSDRILSEDPDIDAAVLIHSPFM
jgi:hypothetical protein